MSAPRSLEADGDSFFANLDELCARSEITIDRPKNSRHPRVRAAIYPVDYGYLADTTGGDGDGVDVFRGGATGLGVVGVFLTADVVKKDVEVKVLLDCGPEETAQIRHLLQGVLGIGGMLVQRQKAPPQEDSASTPPPS